MLSRIANWLLRSLVGSVLSDSTTGIKMFHRSVFERLHLKARPVGWAVVFEMSIKAQLIGLKLGEVPVTSIDRLYGGKSTFRLGPWFVEYLRWFWWGAIQLRRTSGCKRTQVMVRIPVAMTT
jgi:dolichol-phosphate mannosyltransferase